MRKCIDYLLACLLLGASSLAMAQADDEWKGVLSAILSDTESIDSNVGNVLNALSSVTANQDRDFSVSQAIAQELHTIATNQNNSTSSEIGSIISQDGIMVEGWDNLMDALDKLLTEEKFVYEMSKQNTLLDELITPLAKEETLERFRVGMDEHMDTVNYNLQDISAKLVGVQEGLQTIAEQLPYDDSQSWEEDEPPTGSEYEPPTSTPENEYESEVSNDFEAGTLEQMDQTAFTTFFQSTLVPWLDSGGKIDDFWSSTRPEATLEVTPEIDIAGFVIPAVSLSMDGDFGRFCDMSATITGVGYLMGFVYCVYKLSTREYRYYMSLGRDGGGE